jgi:hypothetical protein
MEKELSIVEAGSFNEVVKLKRRRISGYQRLDEAIFSGL